jgi:hypothetical protein
VGVGPSAPGTELRVRQGEWLRVRFINHLPVATTIHWHGIRLPLEMDGVPYVPQLPVLPGEYFDYNSACRMPAATGITRMSAAAKNSRAGRAVDRRRARADRFQVRKDPEPEELAHRRARHFVEFSIPREAARGGTAGRLSTINGVPTPVIELPPGRSPGCACSTSTTP